MVRPDRLKAILGGLLAGSLEIDIKRMILSESSKHINVKLDICLGVLWTPLEAIFSVRHYWVLGLGKWD